MGSMLCVSVASPRWELDDKGYSGKGQLLRYVFASCRFI